MCYNAHMNKIEASCNTQIQNIKRVLGIRKISYTEIVELPQLPTPATMRDSYRSVLNGNAGIFLEPGSDFTNLPGSGI